MSFKLLVKRIQSKNSLLVLSWYFNFTWQSLILFGKFAWVVYFHILEELNIDICDLDYISTGVNVYLYENVEYQTVDIGYSSPLSSSVKIVIDPELKKVEWQNHKKISKDSFAFPSCFLILQHFIRNKYNFNLIG